MKTYNNITIGTILVDIFYGKFFFLIEWIEIKATVYNLKT